METFRETPDIETASEDYAARFEGAIGAYFLSVQSRMVLDSLSTETVQTVLDVGGGHGQMYSPLTGKGYEVTVTGSSPDCRKRLTASHSSGGVRFVACDLLSLPFPDRSFSAVIAFRLIPHIEQWQGMISEMCRVAQKVVVFDYPDIRSTNILYRLAFRMKLALEKNTRTFRLFSRRMIAHELRSNGFGHIDFLPQFLMPMVAYRALQSPGIARFLEGGARATGLTKFLGSPVITRASRDSARLQLDRDIP